MKVLCFTTSYRRPKMLRTCILEVMNQSYPDVVHGVNIAYNPTDLYENSLILIDDLMNQPSLHVVVSENLNQHLNHMHAIQCVPNYESYDLFVKIDDDDIYKKDYISAIVDHMQKTGCDISSSRVCWQLNGHNILPVNRSNLGANPIGSNYHMPPTFAFNKKALYSIIDIDGKAGWEDLLWRHRWDACGLKHEPIDNSKNIIWHIHGANVSTASFLLSQGVISERHVSEFCNSYNAFGEFGGLLSRVWIYNKTILVVDFKIKDYSLAFEVSTLNGSDFILEVFDRGEKLILPIDGDLVKLDKSKKMQLFEFSYNNEESYKSVVNNIDKFIDSLIENDHHL